jgi:hypothetical protein
MKSVLALVIRSDYEISDKLDEFLSSLKSRCNYLRHGPGILLKFLADSAEQQWIKMPSPV